MLFCWLLWKYLRDGASNNNTQSAVLATKENSFEEENRVLCFNHSMQLSAKTLLTPFNAGLGSTASIKKDTKKADVKPKATTCDLCQSLGPNHEPSCVYACPHDAAHRMKGSQLFDLVRASSFG